MLINARPLRGAAAAVATFAAVGTITALWPNPIFGRMTPAQGFEIWLLALQAVLVGVYVATKRPVCSAKPMGVGALLGFLGVACPTCNKVLILLFSSEFLVASVEPLRLPVGLAGTALIAGAVAWEWRQARRVSVAA